MKKISKQCRWTLHLWVTFKCEIIQQMLKLSENDIDNLKIQVMQYANSYVTNFYQLLEQLGKSGTQILIGWSNTLRGSNFGRSAYLKKEKITIISNQS